MNAQWFELRQASLPNNVPGLRVLVVDGRIASVDHFGKLFAPLREYVERRGGTVRELGRDDP